MPQVVQIQRSPNSWDQAGQTVQQTADNFLKSMLAMGQMQSNNALHMSTLNMQNQRLADANTRDDKRWAEQQAAQDRAFAQQDKWKQQEMALQRDALGRQYAAMNKPQLVQGTDAYGRPTFGWVSPGSTAPKMIDFTGGGQQGGASTIPGLDAAAGAGMNEVLSPGWSPMSGGGQNSGPSLADLGVKAGILPAPQNDSTQPPADGIQGAMPMASGHGQAQGATFTPQADTRPVSQLSLAELGQRAGVLPKPQAQQQTQFKPGDTIDPAGNSISIPDGIPWNGPHEVTLGDGKKWSVMINPRSGAMRILGGKNPDQLDSLPMDTGARKEAMDLRSQWDEAARVEKQLNSFGETGGNGGTGLLLGMLPQTIQSRIDPEGVPLRSAISQMSSVIMNALSGAAVSDQERKRLEGFLPTSSDDITTIKQKLAGYKDYISTKTSSWRTMYGDIKPLADIQMGSGSQAGGVPAQSQPLSGATGKRFTFNPQTGRLE